MDPEKGKTVIESEAPAEHSTYDPASAPPTMPPGRGYAPAQAGKSPEPIPVGYGGAAAGPTRVGPFEVPGGYAAAPMPSYAAAPGPREEYYAPLLGAQRPEGYDEEAATWAAYAAGFADARIRRDFVRKVLGIVFIQLAVTVALAATFYYVEPAKEYVQRQVWPFWAAWGLGFAVIIAMGCSERMRRQYPTNLITLAIFTLAMATVVGITTSFYDAEVVVIAFGLTAVVVGLVWATATLTNFDFTTAGGAMYMITWAFIGAMLIGMFWISNTFILIISVVGAVLFSLWLLMDIQMLMGGRTVAIAPDEYVFAAINIYLDIINIFLNILNILTAYNRQ